MGSESLGSYEQCHQGGGPTAKGSAGHGWLPASESQGQSPITAACGTQHLAFRQTTRKNGSLEDPSYSLVIGGHQTQVGFGSSAGCQAGAT